MSTSTSRNYRVPPSEARAKSAAGRRAAISGGVSARRAAVDCFTTAAWDRGMNSIDQAVRRLLTLVAPACIVGRARCWQRLRPAPRQPTLRRRKGRTRSSWRRPTAAARRRNGPAKSSTTPVASCSCGFPTDTKNRFRPARILTQSTPLCCRATGRRYGLGRGKFSPRAGALSRRTRGSTRNPRMGAPANSGPDCLVL